MDQNIVLRSGPCAEAYDKSLIQVQSHGKFAVSFDKRRCDLRVNTVEVKNDQRTVSVSELLTVWRTGNSSPVKICRKDPIGIEISLLTASSNTVRQRCEHYHKKKQAASH